MFNQLYRLYLKRVFDFSAAVIGLIILSPIIILVMILIWLEDRHSPFYIAPRVGKGGKIFKMVKFRSMRVDADKTGVSSTKADDDRITRVGRYIRKFKLDEFMQLWNVLKGDMSLVGPRPQVEWAVKLYTEEEKRLLNVRPGITDWASIVFSNEGEILAGELDPDTAYFEKIHPTKSRLAILNVEHSRLTSDLFVIALTAVAAVDSQSARATLLSSIKEKRGIDSMLLKDQPIRVTPPTA